jgi:imidazolonepropionase-like amidohydrolase
MEVESSLLIMSSADSAAGSVREVPSDSVVKVSGPVLPDGEVRDLYVVDGRITLEKQAGAETVASGWVVPGLVDAHCHLGLDDEGGTSDAEAEQQAIDDRDAGALLIRDAGSASDTSWIHDREDLPRLIRAGRHIARTKRYIRNYAHEVEPEDLAGYVAQEAQRGDGWVKLVGDWISRETGDLSPSFAPEEFAEAIAVAHEHGAKVTAHCFGTAVLPGLIEAGIDCIEHGTGLTPDLVEAMVAHGTALVPTVMQVDKFPEYAEAGAEKFPTYSATMTDLYARRTATIMAAHEAGVPLYAGSDGGGERKHGNIAGEVIAMAGLGMSNEAALGAASWRAREWLGWNATLDEGAPADLVVYDANPLDDLSVLARPMCVMLRGRVVAP